MTQTKGVMTLESKVRVIGRGRAANVAEKIGAIGHFWHTGGVTGRPSSTDRTFTLRAEAGVVISVVYCPAVG